MTTATTAKSQIYITSLFKISSRSWTKKNNFFNGNITAENSDMINDPSGFSAEIFQLKIPDADR